MREKGTLIKRMMVSILLAIVCPALAVEIEEVEVTTEPLDRLTQSYHGYVEYRVRLRNLSSSDDKRLDLTYPRHSWSSGNCIEGIRKTVVLRPHTEVVVSLLQPPLAMNGSNELGVLINGEEVGVPMPMQQHGLSGGRYRRNNTPHACLLYSRGMSSEIDKHVKDLYEITKSASRSSSRSSSTILYELKRSEMDVAQWSGRWLGYSAFDAIFMSGQEFQTAPNPVRDAMGCYVECGGTLVIGGSWQAPPAWRTAKTTKDGMDCYYAGLGVCYHLLQGDPDAWSQAAWKQMHRTWQAGMQGMSSMSTPEQAHDNFPVVENLAVPARGIFLLMLVFALLIGPLNLLFFSKKGQRMRLFWTVPLVSLLTSGVVFGYSLWNEGVTGKVRIAGITWLDQRSHHAVTLGCLGYYCPLTPGGGLTFDQETEVTPQAALANYRSAGRSFTLSWSDRQELDGGWVTARVPSHLMLRRHETRRERLVVRRDTEGQLFVTNGLGTRIKQVWMADNDGRIYSAQGLEEGRSEPLTLQSGTTELAPTECLHQLYNHTWLRRIETLLETPHQVLRPGTYVAVLEGQPFMERGQDSFRVIKTDALVIGILD